MRKIVQGKKTEKGNKKKFEERVARMEMVDDFDDYNSDDDGDDGRELRSVMRASHERYEAEQARMDKRWGGAGSSRAPNPYEDTARRGCLDPLLHRTQSMKQPKILTSIMGDMKLRALKMGRAISKFFHYNQIPPNVATSPYYWAMLDTIAKVGTGVKHPSAYEISGKSIDTSGHPYDAQYLYKLMDETLHIIDGWDEYGVAVVRDNAANFKVVGKILHGKMPYIVCVPCVAICVDLIMEDIGKLEDVQKTIDEGKMVRGLIYNHQFMAGLLKEITSEAGYYTVCYAFRGP
ncbi:hypothetical protein CKAN_01697600 [Cinnamomum micranthum f. kanehirae]|uniref:DUF659 domain-containing protein n=1 Tax=Cinnamomum micranthum f. kanehirae TaxID=337451 RepID=A0A443PB46_9MAGN|nr:hypothetical protein CKAN_01697600 [Cinnamomum micranthum f. kanehirae]